MRYLIILTNLIFCFSGYTFAASETCQTPSVVKYTVENKILNKITELHLFRKERMVAHHYPATQITEAWELNAANMIKPTRFFDAHQRAIEYQPNESVHGKVETDFSYRYQLISDKVLKRADVLKTEFSGCKQTQTLSLETPSRLFEVVYLPNQKTVKSFVMKNKKAQILEHWHARQVISDKQLTDTFFVKRFAYHADDFADIGDVHDDPFLNNMVNLGFIEAGASGFYEAHQDGTVKSMGTHSH